jgi:hypothetical protein
MKTIARLTVALVAIYAAPRLLLHLTGLLAPFGVQVAWAGTLLAGAFDWEWWAASVPFAAFVWVLEIWAGPGPGLGAGLAVVSTCAISSVERAR